MYRRNQNSPFRESNVTWSHKEQICRRQGTLFITSPRELQVLYNITFGKTLLESNVVLWVLGQRVYKWIPYIYKKNQYRLRINPIIPLIFRLVTVDPQVILKTKEGGAATSHNTCALMPRQEREGTVGTLLQGQSLPNHPCLSRHRATWLSGEMRVMEHYLLPPCKENSIQLPLALTSPESARLGSGGRFTAAERAVGSERLCAQALWDFLQDEKRLQLKQSEVICRPRIW